MAAHLRPCRGRCLVASFRDVSGARGRVSAERTVLLAVGRLPVSRGAESDVPLERSVLRVVEDRLRVLMHDRVPAVFVAERGHAVTFSRVFFSGITTSIPDSSGLLSA